MEQHDYETEMAKIQAESKRLAFECDDWVLRKSTPKIRVYSTNVPYSKNPVFKTETMINVEPQKCLDMLWPTGPYRFMWDPFPESCHLIKNVNKTTLIAYQVVKSQLKGLIKPRDTIDLFEFKTTEEHRSCVFSSIRWDEEIQWRKPHYVRGWNYPCGIYFIPTENHKQTKIVCILNVNMTLQVMNMTITIPQLILENILISKLLTYMNALEKTNTTVDWKPLVGLTC